MRCCHFMFVCMYICIYVYPSHSTRDTLIAQLLAAIVLFPAVCRRHTRQVGSTLYHHWPRICSLYCLITVCCIRLSLVFNHTDTSTMHSAWPGPLPLPPREVHNVCAVHVHNYVGVDWTACTLVPEATNTFKIVTHELSAPSHVAHTCKTDTE